MALGAGTHLGPYEILGLLGAGGMGEVYRARDPRLSRDVAVKVLPTLFARDPERLQRFEQEARAAGQLNHPNVLAIYDVGVAQGAPYLVTELLEGETLRQTIARGPLPPRQALDYSAQVARGLAAAHAKGIVHRDLKPENLLVTPEDHVKILDFGLAKLTRAEEAQPEETTPALYSMTAAGEAVGTVSYMAPEQVRGKGTDHRADLFALGAILFELLTGERAFPGETPADRISAILRSEPSSLPEEVERAAPGVGLIIHRCLEKRPEARVDTAKDLGFALELVQKGAALRGRSGAREEPAAPLANAEGLMFRRLTYREGTVLGARFTRDGQTVVYSAAWEGKPPEIYVTRVEYPDSRPIGLTDANLLSLAPTSELAVQIRRRDVGGFVVLGTLARVPFMGGVPREMIEDVYQADWAPDGRNLAVVRQVGGLARLEYPIGTVLYEAEGWLSHLRVAPDGGRVAVFHHPIRGDNGGDLLVIDRDGRVTTLLSGWTMLWGLAWSADGTRPWISGAQDPSHGQGIFDVRSEREVRVLYRAPGFPYLHDIAPSGDALVVNVSPRMRLELGTRGQAHVRNLSWLDWSLLRDMTPDGRRVLSDESGPGAGGTITMYMRDADGSPAVRLGEGYGAGFSPDGRWALGIDPLRHDALLLYPTGPGQTVVHSIPGVRCQSAHWFPDGKSVCISGTEPGKRPRLYRYDLESRALSPFSEEGMGAMMGQVSPDGKHVIGSTPEGKWAIFPTDGGDPRPLPGIREQERPMEWTEDGKCVYTLERGILPAPIQRIDVETGRRELHLEITPPNPSGVDGINNLRLSADGESYAYSYPQVLAELYLARGLG
jgi:Tol biopolymer transport system component